LDTELYASTHHHVAVFYDMLEQAAKEAK